MTRKSSKIPAPPPDPPDPPDPPGAIRDADALFIATLREIADAMVAAGFPEPGLPTFVRIAANELERYYAAGLVAPRPGDGAPENPQ